MQSIRDHLRPISNEYNRWINGSYLYDLFEFKNGYTVGNDYISKVFNANTHEIKRKYILLH